MGRPVRRRDASGWMSRIKRPAIQLWSAYLAIGVLALVVHAMLETGSLPQSYFYDIVGASAVAAATVGIVRNAPDRRMPWILMVAGQAMFVAGDLMWNWYEIIGEAPFPSLADVLYLAGYPFLAAGLFLLIRRRMGGGNRAASWMPRSSRRPPPSCRGRSSSGRRWPGRAWTRWPSGSAWRTP